MLWVTGSTCSAEILSQLNLVELRLMLQMAVRTKTFT